MRKLDRLRKELFKGKPPYITVPHPTKDDLDQVWTRYDHWWLNSWFLNEMDWQPTLFKKIKKWLQLEYKMFFEQINSRPKCPTPLSVIRWNIQYGFPNVDWKETIKQRRPVKWKLHGEY